MNRVRSLLIIFGWVFVLSACAGAQADTLNPATQTVQPSPTTTPEWFDVELTDVQTGATFTMNDFTGKVVLVETMAIWCPNCVIQASQVGKLHETLGFPEDLVSVSLDVDANEDEASLKEFAVGYRFDWHFAVAPREVARALGNLYSAQYLNPPLSPMLIIDRKGSVHLLDYGIKESATLQEIVAPYLNQ